MQYAAPQHGRAIMPPKVLTFLCTPLANRTLLFEAPVQHTCRTMWRRIFSITLWSSIKAINFISAPQWLQMRGSTSQRRGSREEGQSFFYYFWVDVRESIT